jgi:transcriptional regulator with XRE-family HTH domain
MEREGKELSSLSSLLDRAGVNLTQIAKALDKRHATVSDWKRGKHAPRLEPYEYVVLLDLLKCTPEELAGVFPKKEDAE